MRAEKPIRDAQKQTSLAKRFYQRVSLHKDGDHFVVLLDGQYVKTPAKNILAIPHERIADMIVSEWEGQGTHIHLAQMPLTRMMNSAIDGVKQNIEAVFNEIISFCRTDMLFYRAESPQELIDRQIAAWDSIIHWFAFEIGAEFQCTQGIMHIKQSPVAIGAYSDRLRRYASPFCLTGIYSATTIMGSALLALALVEKRISLEEAWDAAHVDEDWNISQWGWDQEAEQRRSFRFADMKAAALLMDCFKPKW